MKLRNREEYWTSRRARKAHRCETERCRSQARIEPGDRYVLMELPPNSEMGNADWWRMKSCLPCAYDFNAELAARVFAPRPWTPDEKTATGTRVHVKRACNGCSSLLGDVTEAEIAAAISGAPAADVRGECPRCSLVVTS